MSRYIEIITITLLIKVLLLLLVVLTNQNHNFSLIDSWVRWDGPHYIDIAKNGYQTQGDPANFIVFYPLYPLLIKSLGIIVGNFNLASLIISWIFSCLAALFLFELVLLDFNKRLALLSVWFLNIFPTAYFLQASYTESLFLATSLASSYFFRKSNLLGSGIFGGLSALTRFNGLLLLPLFFSEELFKKSNWQKFIDVILVSLTTLTGFIIYLIINFLTFGDFFYFTKPLAEHWYKTFQWPLISIQNLINFINSMQGNSYFIFLGELIALISTSILTIYVFLKVRKSYGIYMLMSLLLFTSTSFILSTPRYILVLFPIYIALAKLSNKIFFALSSGIFISILIYLTLQYTKGAWAY